LRRHPRRARAAGRPARARARRLQPRRRGRPARDRRARLAGAARAGAGGGRAPASRLRRARLGGRLRPRPVLVPDPHVRLSEGKPPPFRTLPRSSSRPRASKERPGCRREGGRMAGSQAFEWLCEAIEAGTSLERLEARGTVRIALKQAGLEARSATAAELAVVVGKILPRELRQRG